MKKQSTISRGLRLDAREYIARRAAMPRKDLVHLVRCFGLKAGQRSKLELATMLWNLTDRLRTR